MSEDITAEDSETTPIRQGGNTPDPFTKSASRVCIVGFADGHRADAPFGEPDMEFWGINRLWAVLPDRVWHRWFEIHNLDTFYSDDTEHQAFLKAADFPVYVRGQDMPTAAAWGIDTAVPYPREMAASMFEPYFTNTISYLIALAIMMGFEEIHMYGVDMAQDSILHQEYSHQRPSCEYFLGIAQGAGIKVVLPPGTDLLQASHWYGFDDDKFQHKLQKRFMEVASRKEAIRGEMQKVAAQRNQFEAQEAFLQARISEADGSMQELQYQLRNLVTPEAKPVTEEEGTGAVHG